MEKQNSAKTQELTVDIRAAGLSAMEDEILLHTVMFILDSQMVPFWEMPTTET
jgi:hypothetical protein